MNKLSPQTEEQLLHLLDGTLGEKESIQLKIEMEKSDVLKKRYHELRTIQTFLLRKTQLEEPSRNFTQRVMEGLDNYAVNAASTHKNGLILLAGIIIASAVAILLLTNGVFDETSTSLVIDTTRVTNKWVQTPTLNIPLDIKTLVNGIIFLNLGIAFILLDRTVLKPLFQKRMMMN